MPAYGDYAGSRGAGGESGYASGGGGGGEYRGDQGGYGGGGVVEQEKKDNDKRNMMLAAGGALAVGVIGGAVIAEALGMCCLLFPFSFPLLRESWRIVC